MPLTARHSAVLPLLVAVAISEYCSAGGSSIRGAASLSSYGRQPRQVQGQPTEDCSSAAAGGRQDIQVSRLGTAIAAVGDTIMFKCQSLPDICRGPEKWFTIADSRIADRVVQESENASVLYLCIFEDSNGTYIKCNCRDHQNQDRTVDWVFVIASYLNYNTTNVTCWVNRDSTLTCHWKSIYTGVLSAQTNWIVHYEVLGAEDEVNGTCHVHTGNTWCTTTEQASLYMAYRFYFTSVNALGHFTTEATITFTPDSVKPDLFDVSEGNTTTTSVELKLSVNQEALGSSLVDNILTTTGFECDAHVRKVDSADVIRVEKFMIQKQVNFSDFLVFMSPQDEPMRFAHTVKGLLPFQTYSTEVRCRVAGTGLFWSDNIYLTVRTNESAPWVGPVVAGFSQSKQECVNGGHGYNIYWQGIREASGASNGLLTGYVVRLNAGDSYSDDPDCSLAATVGPKERQAWICLPGSGRHVATVHAATSKGIGPAAGEIVIPPRDTVTASALKSCQVFVRKVNITTVSVSFKDSVAGGSRKILNASKGSSDKKKNDEAVPSGGSFSALWCLHEDGQCKGDVHWMPLALNATAVQVAVDGSVSDYRFGISKTTNGVSVGIAWSECNRDHLAGPSMPDKPSVEVQEKAIHVRIKRTHCSEAVIPEEPQILYYCEGTTNTFLCNDSTAVSTKECCKGSIQSFVLDSCDELVYLPLLDDAKSYVVWLSYAAPWWDHLNSGAVFVSKLSEAPAAWTIEIICTVVSFAAVAGGVLTFLAYRKFKPNMKLGQICKVPALHDIGCSSMTFLGERGEKHKEYFLVMPWQTHDGVCLTEPELIQSQSPLSLSETSEDSGLSSCRSRASGNAMLKDALTNSRHGADEDFLRSTTLFPEDLAIKCTAPADGSDAERCKTQNHYDNNGYHHDENTASVSSTKLMNRAEQEDKINSRNGHTAELQTVTGDTTIGGCYVSNELTSAYSNKGAVMLASLSLSMQSPAARLKEADKQESHSNLGVEELPSADFCPMCHRSKKWSVGSLSPTPTCGCCISSPPADDYCYAGKLPSAPSDEANNSEASSTGYVQCARDYYDDEVNEEPAIVDINQFF